MQADTKSGKLLVRDGYLTCPHCLRNKRLLLVRAETQATNLTVYCRQCKTETIVNIDKGECYLSHGQ